MTKIVVTSSKPVLTHMGRLPKGVPTDVPPTLASFLVEQGVAVLYETKVSMDRPIEAAGTTELLSASPAAPLSPQTTLPTSNAGEKPKRRGRPAKTSAQ
jgi:hypothetical protein